MEDRKDRHLKYPVVALRVRARVRDVLLSYAHQHGRTLSSLLKPLVLREARRCYDELTNPGTPTIEP